MMQLREHRVGTVVILEIAGALTWEDAEQLRKAVAVLLDRGERQIVLDLAEVTHLDSSAIGAIVASQIRADKLGTAVKLANTGRRLKDLLLLTRLVTVFDSYDSLSKAVASYQSED